MAASSSSSSSSSSSFSFMLYMNLLMIMFPGIVKGYMTDSDALLRIKQSLNNPQPLDSWKLGTMPCDDVITWVGLVCSNGIVTNLHLKSMSLSGDLDLTPLTQMAGLRIISLENNSFSGPIPDFNQLGSLKALYLSFNRYSGHIPSDYFAGMTSLKKIWFDANNFTGTIPSSIAQLPNLMELHLEDNHFSGNIPAIGQGQPSLESVNLSYNNLTGEVPPGLARFDASSFEGNPGLCGAKFGKACDEPPQQPKPPIIQKKTSKKKSLRMEYVVMVVSLLILVMMVVAICVLVRRRRRRRRKDNYSETIGIMEKDDNIEGSVGVTICSISKPEAIPGQNSFGTGQKSLMGRKKADVDLMLLNKSKGVFRLSDVMKAAAEVLGNGMLGSSYKATMSNGMTVVVKRLKEMNVVDKNGFEAEMMRLGKLSHPNVLPPLACHYRKDEKLLIYDYIPTGSLLYLLHGKGRHAELNWQARLKIIQGMAQGMGYIHRELGMLELPHGNLKSSNVLVGPGPGWQALVMDFGLYGMINKRQALAGYKAPEAAVYGGEVTAKSDVYCVGIVILEVVTLTDVSRGQGGTDVVEWVRSAMEEGREEELLDPEMRNDEMKRLLHIGAACTETDPRRRLDIREVISRIESIISMMNNTEDDERRIEMDDEAAATASSTLTDSSYVSVIGRGIE